jgi:hypothetical protein
MKKIILLLGIIVLTGCQTVTEVFVTDGSKSEGTVTLSYDYGLLDKVEINQGKANKKALKRCIGWGYGGIEAFDGLKSCIDRGIYGDCYAYRVTVKYQCLDN